MDSPPDQEILIPNREAAIKQSRQKIKLWMTVYAKSVLIWDIILLLIFLYLLANSSPKFPNSYVETRKNIHHVTNTIAMIFKLLCPVLMIYVIHRIQKETLSISEYVVMISDVLLCKLVAVIILLFCYVMNQLESPFSFNGFIILHLVEVIFRLVVITVFDLDFPGRVVQDGGVWEENLIEMVTENLKDVGLA